MATRLALALLLALALCASAVAAPTQKKKPARSDLSPAASAATQFRAAVRDLLLNLAERRRGGGGGGGGRGSGGRGGRGSAAAAAAAALAARPGRGRGRGGSGGFDDDDDDDDDEEEDEDDNDNSCFPAVASVSTPHGPVNMSELVIGSLVSSAVGPTGVHAFTHRLPAGKFAFLRLQTVAGALTVSPGHYVHTGRGLLPARAVRAGDTLQRDDGSARVVSVARTTEDGLYNPQTTVGELVVDGFRVSCYTTAVAPRAAHALLAPLRAVFNALGADATGGSLVGGASTTLHGLVGAARMRGA